VRRTGAIIKRTVVSFYNDQMTQHAAALTYYGLMSLFPAALLAVSLLGLIGQYPDTYNAIIGYLRKVAPASVVAPLDSSLRTALQHKGTAATTLVVSIVVALYGTTGVLEAARRAMNVIFGIKHGRSFFMRKLIDVASSVVLMVMVLTTLVLVFVGGRFANDLFGFIGLGGDGAHIWSLVRWPLAVVVAMLGFAGVYYVTPDVKHRSFRFVLPGAVVAVVLWLLASYAFSTYVSRIADVGALYGTFTAAIVLVGWMWLTNVALLFGAELNAELGRQKELDAGVSHHETLELQARQR
jgi:membrane protein